MLWELSTPFVFMRWLLHSLGRHEGRLYMANGVAMIVVFFLCRNALGVGPPLAPVLSASCSYYPCPCLLLQSSIWSGKALRMAKLTTPLLEGICTLRSRGEQDKSW